MAVLADDFEALLKGAKTFHIEDDFTHFVTTDLWTSILTDSGTATVTADPTDGVANMGGVLVIDPSDSTQADNDQTYVATTTEMFQFTTDKPMFFMAKVRPLSNTIGSANFIAGFKNAPAAEQLVDAGAVPVVTGSGAFIYKLDGGTKWVCTATCNGTESTTNGVTSDHTVGNNAWDILAIKTIPKSSTETEVHFYSADVQTNGDFTLREIGLETSGKQFVAQKITHTSSTAMDVFFGVKEGAVNLTTELHVDWVYASQRR